MKCNFKCTFCSSTNIGDNNHDQVSLEQVFRFLKRFPETNTIIVNGGDPLMMSPSYYWDLIEHLDNNNYKASISFTSNLYPFYLKPEKWIDLFKHPRMGIATSFQYGNARLKHDLTPYTEDEFWKVSDLMLKEVGYRPTFIAVITEENDDTVIKTVELAKAMDVVCKVNYAYGTGEVVSYKNITMGNKDKPYRLSKIYHHYVDIYEAGLMDWEHNTQDLFRKLNNEHTICPLNRSCDEGIRAIQPSGRYYSCGAFGDSNEYPIDFEKEMNGEFFTPLQDAFELNQMKQSCFSCPMFNICNGCHKTIHELKKTNQVEDHCKDMKKVAKRLRDLGLLETEITPYVNENETFNEVRKYGKTIPIFVA